MEKQKSLKKAFAWQISNVVLHAVLQLVYYGILARLLSKTDFGIIAIANVFVNLSVLLSQIGMGPALIQRKNVSQTHITTAFYVSFIISIFVYGITYFTSGIFASFYEQPQLKEIIQVLTLSFVLAAFGSTPLSLLQKRMQFNRLFYVETIAGVFGMGIGIVAAILGYGVWSLVYGTLFLQFLRSLLAWIYAPVNLRIKPGQKEFSQLFHFGFGLTLVRLNNFLSISGLSFILGKMLPMATLGVFERSYRIMILPAKMLGNTIDRVMFPVMSKMQDDENTIKSFYKQNLTLALSLTLATSLWLSLYAKQVVLVLLGSKWMDAVVPLQILFLVLPFRISVRMTDSFVRAKALVYYSAFRKLIFNLVLFGLVIYSVRYGLTGIAIAILVASVFQYFNMIQMAAKYTNLSQSIYYEPFVKAFPIALLLFVPSLLIHLFSESYSFSDSLVWIFSEPFIGLFIFMVLLPVVVKFRPQLINPQINQLVNRFFRFNK